MFYAYVATVSSCTKERNPTLTLTVVLSAMKDMFMGVAHIFPGWKGQHLTPHVATNAAHDSAKHTSMLLLTTIWLAAGD